MLELGIFSFIIGLIDVLLMNVNFRENLREKWDLYLYLYYFLSIFLSLLVEKRNILY